MQFDSDLLQPVHSKEVKKSHSCGSNRELKYADLLGLSAFGKFERVLTNIFDVGDLSCIDVISPKFFETWTFNSDDILKITEHCEQFRDCIKGENISFEMIRCRYKDVPFIIGSWKSVSGDLQRYPKCLIYVRKKVNFQDIFNSIIEMDE